MKLKHNRETKTTEKINENKSWFFENMNKIDTSLARLRKKKKNSNYQYQE